MLCVGAVRGHSARLASAFHCEPGEIIELNAMRSQAVAASPFDALKQVPQTNTETTKLLDSLQATTPTLPVVGSLMKAQIL